MDLITMILMFGGSAVLALVGGVLIGKGDGEPQRAHGSGEEDQLKEIKALRAELAEAKKRSAKSEKFDEDTQVMDHSLTDQLEAEVELLRTELVHKERELEKQTENTNRLGARILEVEDQLHQKQAELLKTVTEREEQVKSELIKEGMDSFMEALQKESDVLRAELENAYQMVNRQERELARLRGDADEPTSESNELHHTIENLTEENSALREQLKSYENMVKKGNRSHPAQTVEVEIGHLEHSGPPKGDISKEALKKSALRTEKAESNQRLISSSEEAETIEQSIIPDGELPAKTNVPSSRGVVPLFSPKRKLTTSQKMKTIVPEGGLPRRRDS